MWGMIADMIAAFLLALPAAWFFILIRMYEKIDKINCNLVYELEMVRDHLREICRKIPDNVTDDEEGFDV